MLVDWLYELAFFQKIFWRNQITFACIFILFMLYHSSLLLIWFVDVLLQLYLSFLCLCNSVFSYFQSELDWHNRKRGVCSIYFILVFSAHADGERLSGTLYKHWAIDVAPETLCMLAQTLSNSLAKGLCTSLCISVVPSTCACVCICMCVYMRSHSAFPSISPPHPQGPAIPLLFLHYFTSGFAAAPSQPPPSMPSPGVPQPTAAPLPSDAMAQTFVDVLLRLFAANFAQLGAVQEVALGLDLFCSFAKSCACLRCLVASLMQDCFSAEILPLFF